ncbi:hypothetical protein OIDMADRAFT_85692, partial [Oidiodendron maius Zn]
MALTWPKATAWPDDLRKHGTHTAASPFRDAPQSIEGAKQQPIRFTRIQTMITSMVVLLAKTELLPDYNTTMRALQTSQNDFTASTTETTKAVTREIAEVRTVATVIL